MKVGGAQALQMAVDQPRRGQVGVVGEDLREPAAQQTECRQVRAAQVRLDQLQVLDHLTGGQLIGLTVAQAPEVGAARTGGLGTAKEEASSAVSVRPAVMVLFYRRSPPGTGGCSPRSRVPTRGSLRTAAPRTGRWRPSTD